VAGTPEGNPGEQAPAPRQAPAPTHAASPSPQPPRGWRAQLRHAFAVEKPGPAEPTPEERAALEPLIREVRKRGLVGPAVLFLESVAPLNNVGAQTLHFMQPMATAVLDPVRYATLAKYLERRGSVAWVVQELQRDTSTGA
jgi:hypothetical protein